MTPEIQEQSQQTKKSKKWSQKKLALVIVAACVLPVLLMIGLSAALFVGQLAKDAEALKNPENYQELHVTVTQIGFDDDNNKRVTDIANFAGKELYFNVIFDSVEDLNRAKAYDYSKYGEVDLYQYPESFSLCAANTDLLIQSGFFGSFEPGAHLTIRAIGDLQTGAHFYRIAAITLDGREYLSFNEGFANILAEK